MNDELKISDIFTNDVMYGTELYKSIKVDRPAFTLTFTQNIVDWINEQYPNRNWIKAEPSLQIPVEDVFNTGVIECIKLQMVDIPDFTVDVDLYGVLTVEDIEKLVRTFCEYLMGVN